MGRISLRMPVVQTTPPPLTVTLRPPSPPGAEHPVKIDVEGLNFYYGAKRALEDICIEIHANQVTALIGPSGCGKSTFLRTLNRMNDIIPGARVEGAVLHRRPATSTRPSVDVVDSAPAGRHGVSEVEPVPEVDLRERRLRPAHQPA